MSFTADSLITWEEMEDNMTCYIGYLPARLKYYTYLSYLYNYSPTDVNAVPLHMNLFYTLIDYYIYYSKKRNINPLLPLLQTMREGNFLDASTFPYASQWDSYKNTANIKVDETVIDGFGSAASACMYKKFNHWTDSIRAQIDRFAWFAGTSKYSNDSNATNKSFDPDNDKPEYWYGYSSTGVQAYDAPSIEAVADKCFFGESSERIVALMNLIFCNIPNATSLHNIESNMSNQVIETFYTPGKSLYTEGTDEYKLLDKVENQITYEMNAKQNLRDAFAAIKTAAEGIETIINREDNEETI